MARMSNRNYEVLIIGAGISGLIAARRLLNHGILNIGVLEARDRLGGRIHSVKNDDDFMDMGAHFVHGSDGNAVYDFANPLGLILPPDQYPDDNCYIFARNLQTEVDAELGTEFEEKFDQLFDLHLSERNGKTIEDIFTAMKPQLLSDPQFQALSTEFKEDLFHQFIKLECLDMATSKPCQVSADGVAAWRDLPEPYYGILKDGYASVLPLIADDLVKSTVNLNTIVSKIEWSSTGCTITCQRKENPEESIVVTANRVICTIPLGCLKADTICFEPPLPENKQLAITTLDFGLVDKFNLQFAKKWWPDNFNNLFIIWPTEPCELDVEASIQSCLNPALYENPDDMKWYRRIYAFDVEPIVKTGFYLVAYASGHWATLIERLPDEELMAGLNALVQTFIKPKFPDAEAPTKLTRSKWQMDPYCRGSYTLMSTESSTKMLETLAEPLPSSANPRLLFAGEATHPHFYASVHGAWETGEREADRVLSVLEPKISEPI